MNSHALFIFSPSERKSHPPSKVIALASYCPSRNPLHHIIIWKDMVYLSGCLFIFSLFNQMKKLLPYSIWHPRGIEQRLTDMQPARIWYSICLLSPKTVFLKKFYLEFVSQYKRKVWNQTIVSCFRKILFYIYAHGFHSFSRFWVLYLLFLALLYWFGRI